MAVQRGIRVRCRAYRGMLVCVPGDECKPITSLLDRMNGLGDEISTEAQRTASEAKKEGGEGFSRTFHAYRTQRSDRVICVICNSKARRSR